MVSVSVAIISLCLQTEAKQTLHLLNTKHVLIHCRNMTDCEWDDYTNDASTYSNWNLVMNQLDIDKAIAC